MTSPLTPQQMEQVLRRTLDDSRLSSTEKRALETVLAELGTSEQQIHVYRHQAFDLARDTLADPRARQVLDWLEDVVKVLQRREPAAAPGTSDACFSPGHDCPSRIAGLFKQARQKVDVCVFTITDDRIADAIHTAHRRGLAVRVLTDNDKAFDPGSDIDDLIAAGVPVRIDRTPYHMHHKFAIFDGELLLNGSYNWTRGAAEHNHENFILTGDRRLVAGFAQTFERLWEELGKQGKSV